MIQNIQTTSIKTQSVKTCSKWFWWRPFGKIQHIQVLHWLFEYKQETRLRRKFVVIGWVILVPLWGLFVRRFDC